MDKRSKLAASFAIILVSLFFPFLASFGVLDEKSITEDTETAQNEENRTCKLCLHELASIDFVKPKENIEINVNVTYKAPNKPAEEMPVIDWDEFYNTAIHLAKMGWGEAGCLSDMEIAACYWTALNRYDNGFGSSVIAVITAENQFIGYRENNRVDDRCLALACDVLYRWHLEKTTDGDVGRVLPKEYCWFSANLTGTENVFRDAFIGGNTWDWNCDNPYEKGN